ncbi:MAG: ATP-binding protein [Betaproteobacteria bacterium]|nr:ATP-binding protein [Betaproteobacteria bacterium]
MDYFENAVRDAALPPDESQAPVPASVQVAVPDAAPTGLQPVRMDRSYAEAPGIALAGLLAAVLTGALLWDRVAPATLYGWLAVHAGLAIATLFLARARRNDALRDQHTRTWALRLTTLGVLTGLAWSPAPIWMGPLGSDALSVAAVTMIAALPVLSAWVFRYYAQGTIGFAAAFLGTYAVYLLAFSEAPLRYPSAFALAGWGAFVCVLSLRWQAILVKLIDASVQQGRYVQGLALANALADSSLRARADFLSNMGHHLRTPLTVVLGMAKLLKIMPLGEEEMEAANMIDRSGEELLGHINQLLDAAELVYGQVRLGHAEFDLRALLEKVGTRMARAAQEKGLIAELRVADDVPHLVRGDESRLRDVLTNLCDNAVKFTAAGRVALLAEKVQGYPTPGRATLKFAVVDTGIGMDKKIAAHVHEPFFQADANAARNFRGAGLGLTIACRLVQLMDGRMSIDSTPGRGSTFSFITEFETAVAGGTTAGAPAQSAPNRVTPGV